jgi:polyisoprenoid-binding protein YceI
MRFNSIERWAARCTTAAPVVVTWNTFGPWSVQLRGWRGQSGTQGKGETNMTTAVSTTDLSSGIWAIDPVHSSINFAVRHLMVSKVRGTFGTFSGAVTVAEDGTASVAAEIDVTSVHSGSEQRDEHIKGEAFFDVDKFPTASFASTGVRADGDGYVLDGEFTFKGVTKPVSLALGFNGVNPGMGRGEVAGFEASVVLNRKDFGIEIDMPLETGGVILGDQVTITLEIEALKQA